MSLINKLLKDLESRQSYLQDNPDLVLDGLYSAYDVEIGDNVNRKKQFYFLLFIIIIMSLVVSLVWVNLSKSNPIIDNSAKSTKYKMVAKAPSIASIQTTTNISKNTESQKTDLSLFSLKMDDLHNKWDGNQALTDKNSNKSLSIKNIDIKERDNNIILSLELPDELEYRVYTLKSPYRTILEIKDIDYTGSLPVIEALPNITNIRKRVDENGNFLFVVQSNDPMAIVDAGYSQSDDAHILQITLSTPSGEEREVSSSSMDIDKVTDNIHPQVLSKDTVTKGELVKTMNEPPKVSEADKQLNKSQELYRKGQVAESLDLLYSIVKKDEDNIKARTTLALMLIEQNQTKLAISLLQEGLLKFPDQTKWSKLLARIYINTGNYTMAKEILTKNMPSITDDPEYHALYAAILQKMSMHEEAALTYQNLVKIQPENGLWWMGLAISLERISRAKDAMFAYQNALNAKLLTPETHRYILERIRYLDTHLSNESS